VHDDVVGDQTTGDRTIVDSCDQDRNLLGRPRKRMLLGEPIRYARSRRECSDHPLSLFGSQVAVLCFHPANHTVLPLPDDGARDRGECGRHVHFEALEIIITVLTKILLDGSPKEFDEV
jgi:hypothetical protein